MSEFPSMKAKRISEIVLRRSNQATNTLFLFIDESGNFDFSDSGTTHFVMACVATLAPLESAGKLNSLKYDLLSEGCDISSFHATEDRQFVRDRVFPLIDGLRNTRAQVIYGDKHLAAPSLHSAENLYALFGNGIMKLALLAFGKDEYHQMKTDANGQIADYICWAKYVLLERNENRPWDSIHQTLKPTNFDIFRNSHTRYY